jgi:hypothetical protein
MSDTRMDFASAPARSLWGVIARRRGGNELLTRDIAANKAAEAMGIMPCRPAAQVGGGRDVRSDPESEGFEEKYRAVINGGDPDDEQVGQRWGKVEPALWGR